MIRERKSTSEIVIPYAIYREMEHTQLLDMLGLDDQKRRNRRRRKAQAIKNDEHQAAPTV